MHQCRPLGVRVGVKMGVSFLTWAYSEEDWSPGEAGGRCGWLKMCREALLKLGWWVRCPAVPWRQTGALSGLFCFCPALSPPSIRMCLLLSPTTQGGQRPHSTPFFLGRLSHNLGQRLAPSVVSAMGEHICWVQAPASSFPRRGKQPHLSATNTSRVSTHRGLGSLQSHVMGKHMGSGCKQARDGMSTLTLCSLCEIRRRHLRG